MRAMLTAGEVSVVVRMSLGVAKGSSRLVQRYVWLDATEEKHGGSESRSKREGLQAAGHAMGRAGSSTTILRNIVDCPPKLLPNVLGSESRAPRVNLEFIRRDVRDWEIPHPARTDWWECLKKVGALSPRRLETISIFNRAKCEFLCATLTKAL